MKQNFQLIIGINIMRYSINRRCRFLLISSEQMIIKHKNATEIFVNIFRVACMMYTVVGRCIENPIPYTQLANFRC